MRMMLNQRDNGEDGKTENTQGRPDSSHSLQELLIFPQPMIGLGRSESVSRMYCEAKKCFCAMLCGGLAYSVVFLFNK